MTDQIHLNKLCKQSENEISFEIWLHCVRDSQQKFEALKGVNVFIVNVVINKEN